MEKTTVRIQGEPDVIEALAGLVKGSDEAELIRVEQDDTGGIGADFDLATIATVVAAVSKVFFTAVLPALLKVLRRHPGSKITIETPTRTVTVVATGDLSAKSLKRILAAAMEP